VNVFIDLSFQFRVNPNRLNDIYEEYGEDYYAAVVRLTYSRLKEITVQYETIEYFTQRPRISQDLSSVVARTLFFDFLNMFVFYDLQLRDIYFDTAFENAVISKLIAAQIRETTLAKRNTSLAEKEIEIQEVISIGYRNFLTANATANGYVETEKAKADALYTLFDKISNAYKDYFNDFLITNDTEKLQLIYATELPYVSANNLYIGMDSAVVYG